MISWTAADTFTIGEVEFVCRPLADRFPSTSRRFCLVKERWHVEWYADLFRELEPRRMVEVGLWDGASVAVAAELTRPDMLIGVDRRVPPTDALEQFIRERDLGERVRPFYDVDQTDTDRLHSLVASEMRGHALDLVIDDASHQLEPTRVTFDALFPYVRPGGAYVIEDWPMHMPFPASRLDGKPLSVLVLELVLASAERPDVIRSVTVDENFAVVTRGDATLDPQLFQLSGCLGPSGRALLQ